MSTKERYERVRAEVDLACEKAGRNPHEVLLLAVSKTVDLDQVHIPDPVAQELCRLECRIAELEREQSARHAAAVEDLIHREEP